MMTSKTTDTSCSGNDLLQKECPQTDCPLRGPSNDPDRCGAGEWIVNGTCALILLIAIVIAAGPVERLIQKTLTEFNHHLVWREPVEQW